MAAYLPEAGEGRTTERDLSGHGYELTWSGATAATLFDTDQGKKIWDKPDGAKAKTNRNMQLDSGHSLFTVFGHTANVTRAFAGKRASGGVVWHLYMISTLKLRYRIDTSTNDTLDTTTTFGSGGGGAEYRYFSFAATYGDPTMTLYVDGEFDTSKSHSAGGPISSAVLPTVVGAVDDVATSIGGRIACFYIWDREITPGEVKTLHNDFFCLFRPALYIPIRSPTPPAPSALSEGSHALMGVGI
jgi:hypothetical protein